MLFLVCVCYAFTHLFIDALWSPAREGADLLALVCDV